MNKFEVAICIRSFSGIFKGRNYNRLGFLKRSINSIFANTTIPFKIIVIDDCSTNQEHLDYLRSLEKLGRIKLIEKGDQKGRQHSFALQLHEGYMSGADYIKVADDDFIYRKGWLDKLVKAYKNLEENLEGKPVGVLTCFNRLGTKYPEMNLKGIRYGIKDHWIGGNWLMSRKVIEKAGMKLEETIDHPENWGSGWIDDGSYQLRMSKELGFANAFILLEEPSLSDHIGEIGIHSTPHNCARGKI